MGKLNNNFIFTEQKKNNKSMKYKLIIYFLAIITLYSFFNSQKVYAATAKVSISPSNPRVGDTFTVNTEIIGNDAYSIHFINLDESSNLEYISMDSQKKASGTTPLTGGITATYKVNEGGEGWISLEYKIESASLVNKNLNLDKITSETFEEKISVNIIPNVKNVKALNAKFEVTDDDVNIRPHPSTTYSSIGSYKKGKQIDVTGMVGDWYQFKYDSSDAYISKDFLKEIKDESKTTESENDKKKDDKTQEENNEEEKKDSNVRDPRDINNNTTMFILIALVIGAGIVVALVYLLKQGKDNKDDEPKYGMQNIEDDNSFSKKKKKKTRKD